MGMIMHDGFNHNRLTVQLRNIKYRVVIRLQQVFSNLVDAGLIKVKWQSVIQSAISVHRD